MCLSRLSLSISFQDSGWKRRYAPASNAVPLILAMNEAEVIEICRQSIYVMLKLVGPVLLVGLVVGVIVSLFQTMTQIQEATLSFIPKMVIVFLVTIWLLPFMMATLGGFTRSLTDRIVQIGMT